LDHGLSLRFEEHEVVLQFDMSAIALPISLTEIARKYALCHVAFALVSTDGVEGFRLHGQSFMPANQP